jgi:hypothetical protein
LGNIADAIVKGVMPGARLIRRIVRGHLPLRDGRPKYSSGIFKREGEPKPSRFTSSQISCSMLITISYVKATGLNKTKTAELRRDDAFGELGIIIWHTINSVTKEKKA